MKHVSIVVPEGECILSSIVGPYKAFVAANTYMKKTGRSPVFDVHLVGITREIKFYDGLFSVHPDQLMSDVVKTDLIIIPAVQPQSLGHNREFIPWITEQYKHGSEVASLCVGAFLLASTGLIKGKRVGP